MHYEIDIYLMGLSVIAGLLLGGIVGHITGYSQGRRETLARQRTAETCRRVIARFPKGGLTR